MIDTVELERRQCAHIDASHRQVVVIEDIVDALYFADRRGVTGGLGRDEMDNCNVDRV